MGKFSDMRTLIGVVLLISVVNYTMSSPDLEKYNSSACSICKCYSQIVDCSNRNLTNTTLPSDFPPDTTTLILTRNRLGNLGDGVFKNLTKLKLLNLFGCSIASLSNGTFKGLTNLKELNISYNQPLSLTKSNTPRGLFVPLTSLEKLKMYGNVGTYDNKDNYTDQQLIPLQNLKELWIDGFTQNPFGKAYENLTSLATIIISGDLITKSWRRTEFCELPNITENFLQHLYQIKNLTIRACGIKSIHEKSFSKLANLQYLDLSDNAYLTLDTAFKGLNGLNTPGIPNLKTLVLNNLGLRTNELCNFKLTAEMARSVSNIPLDELYLDNNRLYSVEFAAFKALPNTLRKVSLVRNKFAVGMYMFYLFYMNNVTTIDLSYQGTSDITLWKEKADKIDTRIGSSVYNYQNSVDIDIDTMDYNYIKSADVVDEQEDGVRSNDYNEESIDAGDVYTTQELYEYSYIRRSADASKTTDNRDFCPDLIPDHYIPAATVTGFIPPKLTYVDLSHSKIGFPYKEMYFNGTNSLKVVNMSNSFIYCWEGPIHGLNKLELIDLSHNFCENMSHKAFDEFRNLKYLNIGYNYLGYSVAHDTEGRTFKNLINLKQLTMRYNSIYTIPTRFFKSLVNLEKMDLMGNRLVSFDVELEHMTKLRYVNLKRNRIVALSPYIMNVFDNIAGSNSSRYGLYIDLKQNLIHCSCNKLPFISWIYQNYATKQERNRLKVNVSVCQYQNEELIKITSKADFGHMLDDLREFCRSYTPLYIGIGVGLGILINVTIAYIVYKYRWRLQYWYYVTLSNHRCRRRHRNQAGYEEIANSFEYDVYVASSADQDNFILDVWRKELKERRNMNVFFQALIKPGKSLAHEIGYGINQSKTVIFLLSKDWTSDQGMLIARSMWFSDITGRISPFAIGIKLGALENAEWKKVQNLKLNALYDYPSDMTENDKLAFWTKLSQNIRSCSLSD